MNIAIITGASSGMGREFVLQLSQYVQVDEIWAIARRREALEGTNRLEGFFISDDDELPRLLVAGGGRVHGGAQQLFKVFAADCFIGEFADTAA